MPAKAPVTRPGKDEAKTSFIMGFATEKMPIPPEARQKNTVPMPQNCGVRATADRGTLPVAITAGAAAAAPSLSSDDEAAATAAPGGVYDGCGRRSVSAQDSIVVA